MEKEKTIYGETGEILKSFVSIVNSGEEKPHATVAIDLDGYITDDNGFITIILSPSETKRLCETLLENMEIANNANYNLLKNKSPF